MIIKKLVSLFIVLVLLINPTSVFADEMSISGNGEGSSSNVNIQSFATNTVEQNNQAEVNNDVSADTNTGENQASDNTGGDTNINTGNAEVVLGVENTMNLSSAEIGCCPSPTEVEIKNNGNDSSNTINLDLTNTTTVNVNNDATITNNIYGYANTGENEANDNGGNVIINTGDIYGKIFVDNGPINVAHVSAGTGGGGLLASISGNGSGSVNDIFFNQNLNTDVRVNNNADIKNILSFYANTGKNKANGNLGNVLIDTGDILVDIFVKNTVNLSFVDVNCCQNPQNPPPCPESECPTPTPPCTENCNPSGPCVSDCGGGGNGGGGGGDSAGAAGPAAVLGAVLPATGGYDLIFLTLAGLLFIASGIMLRRQSNKPLSQVFAFV
ncbi:hypothetical protein A2858_04220 [Candidatus Daviesbacteria bacterium RIFCSPHIGHO2_01_FULL_36_37]|nr:MAG: hypothetical protein US19_C0007G0010 [Candidatus Daviesbacteria bacterium GW2011_GWB1_36_5]KKQ16364.1 MAG: hypothetical protein US28_C0002G0031 [Candidatus Daviesbacteria bacterium GW2011_GWA1_36_8]OGE16380.1 MAG: hypothetical protein A2858_04220 [Candidatus Daviesbacteria bacterium RIFCSPHIGHO2_01_FULL_36_37]OGE32328.1 MAG: hypothetical protein A3C99_02270 [Candidatus Daviesbacteria bacterium RIFCSPHIGHO2_02_FULL_37_9]